MKGIKQLVIAVLLCLSACPLVVDAQTEEIDRKDWLLQMEDQERKIASYIAEHTKPSATNEALKQTFLSMERHEEASEADLPRLAENYLNNYYRREYMNLHPEVLKIYNPGRVSPDQIAGAKDEGKPTGASNILCNYGDFESATVANLPLQGFAGYASPTYNYYTGGLCNFIPTTNVAYSNVGFLNPDDFLITNNVPDPHVPAINQTHNSSKHALRINGDKRCQQFGINMLQKSFSSPTSGRARINFSYALVMQGPHGGSDANGNAFFVARVLDHTGNEVGSRICVPAHISGAGFQSVDLPDCDNTPGYKFRTLWRDWDCDFLEFDIQGGKTYTIEFFLSGCQWNVHYAYAYVDDICADVICCPDPPPAPKNLKCTPYNRGSTLSWDPVPGAASYIVGFIAYDPACCPDPNPPGYATPMGTTATSLSVPASIAHCFSWYVVAVMPDKCQSDPSETWCSCTPAPPAPTNLNCIPFDRGSNLSWNPIAGAAYYTVGIITYDPACCPGSNPPGSAMPINTLTPNFSVPASLAHCFSWSVQVVMTDSSRSAYSITNCSCTPPPPAPTNLGCTTTQNGSSMLSWNPVAGALYYELHMIKNDPLCCPNSPFTMFIIWNVSSSNIEVPNINIYCFSWRVVAVMPDSSRSNTSITKCSCSLLPSLVFNKGSVQGGDSGNTDEKALSVSIVPNPASEHIRFTVSNRDKQSSASKLKISLYDVHGREVIKKDMDDGDQLRLDIHTFADGIYTFEIRDNNKTLFKDKVIIKKQ